jgi:hypothetical protein
MPEERFHAHQGRHISTDDSLVYVCKISVSFCIICCARTPDRHCVRCCKIARRLQPRQYQGCTTRVPAVYCRLDRRQQTTPQVPSTRSTTGRTPQATSRTSCPRRSRSRSSWTLQLQTRQRRQAWVRWSASGRTQNGRQRQGVEQVRRALT